MSRKIQLTKRLGGGVKSHYCGMGAPFGYFFSITWVLRRKVDFSVKKLGVPLTSTIKNGVTPNSHKFVASAAARAALAGGGA